MEHTFEELKKKTVAQLREIASGIDHEAVKGHTQLNKEHLLKAVCTALGLDMHGHHKVTGIEKTSIKNKIRELKKQRDEMLAARNHKELKVVRHKIHKLKRKLHKATV